MKLAFQSIYVTTYLVAQIWAFKAPLGRLVGSTTSRLVPQLRITQTKTMPHYATTLEPSQIVTNDAEGKMSIDNKAFNWEKQWYPIAVDEFTDKTRPQKLWLLGNEIVLWHDRTTWRVFEDSCPHRGVPLSKIVVFAYPIE